MSIERNRTIILLTFFSVAFFEGIFIGNFIHLHNQNTQLIEISMNIPEVQQYLDTNPTATSTINESTETINRGVYRVWVVQWSHRPRAINVYISKSDLEVLQVKEIWVGWD